jgi:FmdE, Molybdenum formylmethanofuran dehydrogenase operon
MVDPKEFLKAALQLHGHECPEMVLGLRAGAAALNWLGVERSAEDQLLALVQFPEAPCFADGVQAITGCTVGKGNVRILRRGPLRLTLVERATRRAVRVAPRPSAALAGLADGEAATLSRRLLHDPAKQLLSVSGQFRYGHRPRSPRGGERRGIDRGQGRPEGLSLTSKPWCVLKAKDRAAVGCEVWNRAAPIQRVEVPSR